VSRPLRYRLYLRRTYALRNTNRRSRRPRTSIIFYVYINYALDFLPHALFGLTSNRVSLIFAPAGCRSLRSNLSILINHCICAILLAQCVRSVCLQSSDKISVHCFTEPLFPLYVHASVRVARAYITVTYINNIYIYIYIYIYIIRTVSSSRKVKPRIRVSALAGYPQQLRAAGVISRAHLAEREGRSRLRAT